MSTTECENVHTPTECENVHTPTECENVHTPTECENVTCSTERVEIKNFTSAECNEQDKQIIDMGMSFATEKQETAKELAKTSKYLYFLQNRLTNALGHTSQRSFNNMSPIENSIKTHENVEIKVLSPANFFSSRWNVPTHKIISLADIKSVDISEMPHFSTGMVEVDRLTGGFFEGQLIILSGKRGEGKSTLASQIVIEAIDQHIPTLVYSGELPNYQFKNWIDLQAAGSDNLIPNLSNGREYFTMKNDEIKESINEWYRDLLYIVDDGDLPEGETELDLIETAIYRHKIKFCLVDNLMCLAEYGEGIYQNQGKVVKKLKEIATAAKCTILLIAHERKLQSSDLSDNISGSSDITNRADVVLRYARSADDNGGYIEVAKNRLFGTLARVASKNQIVTSFDEASRRISTEKSWNMYKVYGWVNQSKPKENLQPIGDDGDLPF